MGRNGRLLLQARQSRWAGTGDAPSRAMRRGTVAVASARSGCPSNAKFGVQRPAASLREPARRSSSHRRGSNGSCTAPRVGCEASPPRPDGTTRCWPTRSSSPPVRRRRRDCCGAAVVGTTRPGLTLRCTRHAGRALELRLRRVFAWRGGAAERGGSRVSRIRRRADRGHLHAEAARSSPATGPSCWLDRAPQIRNIPGAMVADRGVGTVRFRCRGRRRHSSE